jgi:peptidoglycan LD-endopeptidase CwlK
MIAGASPIDVGHPSMTALIFGVTLYFLLAACLLGYAVLPNWRRRVQQGVVKLAGLVCVVRSFAGSFACFACLARFERAGGTRGTDPHSRLRTWAGPDKGATGPAPAPASYPGPGSRQIGQRLTQAVALGFDATKRGRTTGRYGAAQQRSTDRRSPGSVAGSVSEALLASDGGWLWGAALLIVLPLVAAGLRQHWRVETFDHTRARAPDAQVVALLQGEELVPPPAVPPELFVAREVAQVRPLLGQADRDWGRLDPAFRQRLLWVFRLMQERHGYELVLLEGWRSPQRQAQLAALGDHVTRAGPNQSLHQSGRAADVAFLREGRLVLSERDPWAMRAYEHYGALAASLGLTWGGSWTTLRDYGHVEWQGAGTAPMDPRPRSTAISRPLRPSPTLTPPMTSTVAFSRVR